MSDDLLVGQIVIRKLVDDHGEVAVEVDTGEEGDGGDMTLLDILGLLEYAKQAVAVESGEL